MFVFKYCRKEVQVSRNTKSSPHETDNVMHGTFQTDLQHHDQGSQKLWVLAFKGGKLNYQVVAMEEFQTSVMETKCSFNF